jgi:L-asparaginase
MQVMAKKKVKKVVMLGTGGTIAGTALNPEDTLGYASAQLGIGQLAAAIPALQTLQSAQDFELVSEQVAQLDSKDMSHAVWQALAGRVSHHLTQADVRGVVITHGSDTMEETAYFLQAVLPTELIARKPVVLTCAMRPATFVRADGPRNLHDALVVATCAGACGVVAVCAGRVHTALALQKVHPTRLDAFDSGEAGPIGMVSGNVVNLEGNWPVPLVEYAKCDIKKIATFAHWPRVEIVMSHAGASELTVQALLARRDLAPGDWVRGIVVAGTGNGTLNHALEAALLQAQRAGVRVVRSTRCPYGQVQSSPGNPLADSAGLSPVKARIALMLELLAEED